MPFNTNADLTKVRNNVINSNFWKRYSRQDSYYMEFSFCSEFIVFLSSS